MSELFWSRNRKFCIKQNSLWILENDGGTKNKKGKQPCFDSTQRNTKTGRLEDNHPYNDNGIIFSPVNQESIVEVTIKNEDILAQVLNGQKNKINLVLTPKILIYMGRFLGK